MGSSLSLPSEFSQVPQEVEASEDQRKLLLCQRVLAVPAKRMGYRLQDVQWDFPTLRNSA